MIISVKHLPALNLHPVLGGDLFLSSGGRNLFPAGLQYIDPETMDLYDNTLPASWREKLSLNASSIATLLGMAGVPVGKAHFWALGSSARQLGRILSDASYGSFEVNGKYSDAGVIIIDRVSDFFFYIRYL